MKKKPIVKKKITKPITHFEYMANSRSWSESLKAESFMRFPDNAEWRQRFIDLLFKWVEDENELLIEDFCWKYKLSRNTLYEWRDKYEDIRQAVNEVKIKIGSRRRKGVMNFKLQQSATYRDMHMYDPEWGPSVDKYHTGLKIAEEEALKDYTIIMHKPAKKVTPE